MAATIGIDGRIRFSLKRDEALAMQSAIHQALNDAGEMELSLFWLLVESVDDFSPKYGLDNHRIFLRKSAFFAVFSPVIMKYIDIPTQIVIKERVKLEEKPVT